MTEHQAHILVVDDHHEIRELVAGLLSRAGYSVSSVADGVQMRRLLKVQQIDLVVLDLMLPLLLDLALSQPQYTIARAEGATVNCQVCHRGRRSVAGGKLRLLHRAKGPRRHLFRLWLP